MAKTWLSVTVELLGGNGEAFWPPPGRIFAVGRSHTFEDLADAINTAFARWDRSHLSVFNLADGRILTDEFNGPELSDTMDGPLQEAVDYSRAKVARYVKLGDEFKFTFDLGDDWVHHCTVEAAKVDPEEVLGIVPTQPLAYWGWGSMPDQYGRRWAADDDSSPVPAEPDETHPMLDFRWPDNGSAPLVDDKEIRASITTKDADRFLDATTKGDIDDALQQIAGGFALALEHRRARAEPLALSVLNRLTFRGFRGDRELADALLALLRGEPVPGRAVGIDLEMLAMVFSGTTEDSTGGYIDLNTGEAADESAADAATVGEDYAIDPEADPDRWLWFDREMPGEAWDDMNAFVSTLRDPQMRETGQSVIEGKGAFRRFRAFVDEQDLLDRWQLFSEDRKFGRARRLLADNEISVI